MHSISVFFPCYNDAQTIGKMVCVAAETLRRITDDFEVIVVNDGSRDESARVLSELESSCPYLRVVTHEQNRGYGGALRSGFGAATKQLVFYTDGDAQYDPCELAGLYPLLTREVDVVQGWKLARQDPWYRKMVGRAYHHAVSYLFGLHVKDVDCDFRLIRREVLESFPLLSESGCITVELVARIEHAGFGVVETPVHHYPRTYGHSQFFSIRRVSRTLWQLGKLWFRLHLGLDEPVVPVAVPALPVQVD